MPEKRSKKNDFGEHMSEIAYPLSRRHIYQKLLPTLLMGVLFLLLARLDLVSRQPLSKYAAYSLAALFSTLAVLLFLKSLDSRPGLILNGEGIYNNTSYFSPEMIAWKEIRVVRKWTRQKVNLVLIDVEDTSRFYRGKNLFASGLMRLNESLSGTPVFINPGFLAVDFEDILGKIIAAFESESARTDN